MQNKVLIHEILILLGIWVFNTATSTII